MKKLSLFTLSLLLMTAMSGCINDNQNSEEVGATSSPPQVVIKSIAITLPINNQIFMSTDAATFTFSGTCSSNGESLDIKVAGSSVVSTNCSGGSFSETFQKSWLSEGPNTTSIEYSSGETHSINLDLDTIAPSVSITSVTNANLVSESIYTIAGTCNEDGVINGTIGTTAITGTCTAGVFTTNATNISLEPQGVLAISITGTDSAGNVGTPDTTNMNKDSIAPTLTLNALTSINLANVNSYNVSGTCSENGENVDLTIGVFTASVACSAGAFSFTTQNVSAVTDSLTRSVSVTHADTFSNSTTTATNVIKDVLAPTLTITSPAMITQINETFYTVNGTCSESGKTVSGTVDVVPFSTTCSGGNWLYSGINIFFLADGAYTVSVATTDDASNPSGTISSPVTKDTTTALPSITFTNPTSGQGSGNSVTIQIGSIANGDSIEAFTDSICSSSIRTEVSGATTHDMTFTNAAEGTYSYYFIITDTSLNATGCLGPKVYKEDQTAPNNPTGVTMSSPGDATTSNDSTPIFAGTIDSTEEGSTVTIYRDAACSDTIGNDTISSGAFSVLTTLAVDGSQNGLNQFYLKTTDLAGNISSCYNTGLSFTLSGGGLATLPKLAMVGVDSPTSLVSLEDGNQITWIKAADPSNPVDLGIVNAGEVISIEDPGNVADKVDQGDRIESTKACYAVTQGYGTAPWASEAYAGKKFTTYQYRYGGNNPKVYVAAISQTSFVQILQDLDGDGTLDVVDYKNIPGGTVHEFTVTLVDGRPWQVVSDQKINVYYLATSGGAYDKDARVLTPAATDLIGFSWFVTAIEDTTTVNAWRNESGKNYSGVLNINGKMDVGRTYKDNLTRYATRVTADKPVSLLQIADQDGINATPHLPVSMLATSYGIPRDADYIGIISLVASTVQVINPDGSIKGTFNTTQNAGADANAPFALKYTDGATVAAGTRLICSNPCFMIYDDEGPGADRDETILMGFTP